MIIICREKEAENTVFRYKNVAAYSLSKKMKGFKNDKIELSYSQVPFLPDEDVINSVLTRDVKASKVIKRAIKDLRNPAKADDPKAVISATMTMNMTVSSGKRQNIIVFVLDNELETPEDKAREKFLIKYITAICKEFGIVPITKMNKKIKKLFKGKKKNISKNIEKWLRSGKSGKYGPSRTTVRYCKRLITYFAVELHQAGLSSKDIDQISNRECRDLARTLYSIFTNDNLKRICETTKSKEADKLCKKLAKKNKVAFETYEQIRKILREMSSDYKIPKAEYGYPNRKKDNKKLKKLKGKKYKKFNKKIKKTNYNKPFLNESKFVKKLAKSKMSSILQLIYMNIAYVQMSDEAIGSNEWAKVIQKKLTNSFNKEFAVTFVDVAKKLAAAE